MSDFPSGPTDSILRQLQDSRAEVVIVDIPAHDAHRAIRTIELIRATTLQIAIFANGEMTQPARHCGQHARGRRRISGRFSRFRSSARSLDSLQFVTHTRLWEAPAKPASSHFSAPKAAPAAPLPR